MIQRSNISFVILLFIRSHYLEQIMEHCQRFVLVDPHKFEQLRQPKTEPSVITQTGGNASSLETLQEEHQYQSTNKQQPSVDKNTCSDCEKTFARRLNYRRHLALVHRMDIHGKPIDETTFLRYKTWNQRCAQSQHETQQQKNKSNLNNDMYISKRPQPSGILETTGMVKSKQMAHRRHINQEPRNNVRKVDPVSVNGYTNKTQPIRKKKRALTPEQRRTLRKRIAKSWLAY